MCGRWSCLLLLALTMSATSLCAADLIAPLEVREIVADGRHNAFTAFVRWQDAYWLAFRSAESHNSKDGDLVVLRSTDTKTWTEALRLNILPDDRDPQFLATEKRLFLYDPALEGPRLTSYVTYTDDGRNWTPAQPVYEPRFIFWKPVAHNGKFYATAHVKAEGNDGGSVRAVHLITSPNGLDWKKVSVMRAGNWESETTLYFGPDETLYGFIRTKYSTAGHILTAQPPYTDWKQHEAGTHFSGHSIAKFDGVVYLFSRTMDGDKTGTMIYTFADGKLTPYCRLPSGGDCSYPQAVRNGDEMFVSFYSSHTGKTNIYLASVPLKQPAK